MSAATKWNSGAELSSCGRYRYRLERDGWNGDDLRTCLFVMLNPSTADAQNDDPTIRKCVGFTRRWGYGKLVVCNLFAFRSTKPEGLIDAMDPIGPENDRTLRDEAAIAALIVFAWGSHAVLGVRLSTRAWVVRQMLAPHADRFATLGLAKDRQPRHPLMLAYETELRMTNPGPKP